MDSKCSAAFSNVSGDGFSLDAEPPDDTLVGEAGKDLTAHFVISLGRYAEDDFVTKAELCRVFDVSDRTIQRMVERFELPPPMTLAGRKVWHTGKLRTWILAAAERTESEAIREAKRLRVI